MAKKRSDETVSDDEAERRATEALRRALTTRPTPQKEMVGKTGHPKLPRTAQKKRN